jgi:hypothetical protein
MKLSFVVSNPMDLRPKKYPPASNKRTMIGQDSHGLDGVFSGVGDNRCNGMLKRASGKKIETWVAIQHLSKTLRLRLYHLGAQTDARKH